MSQTAPQSTAPRGTPPDGPHQDPGTMVFGPIIAWLKRSALGWCVIALAVLLLIVFAIWGTLPDSRKERVIDWLLSPKSPPAVTAALNDDMSASVVATPSGPLLKQPAQPASVSVVFTFEIWEERKETIKLEGRNTTLAKRFVPNTGYSIDTTSVRIKKTHGESSGSPAITRLSPEGFEISMYVASSIRGLRLQKGWGRFDATWKEKMLQTIGHEEHDLQSGGTVIFHMPAGANSFELTIREPNGRKLVITGPQDLPDYVVSVDRDRLIVSRKAAP